MERFLEAPEVVFQIGPVPITETVFNGWIVMLGLIAVGFVATRSLSTRPRGIQTLSEMIVNGVKELINMTMGSDKMGFLGYMGSLILFILAANVIGITGMRPPTSDLNITLGLAALTFLMTHYYGMKSHGVGGYIKALAEPVALLMPINLIGELARPVSLAVRLFGNILGGTIIMVMIYDVVAVIVPIPLHFYFDVFVGLLQSFIFVALTMVFVGLAMD